MLILVLNPENGSDTFLRNAGWLFNGLDGVISQNIELFTYLFIRFEFSGYGPNDQGIGVRFWTGTEILLFPIGFIPALRPTQSSAQWHREIIWRGHLADHSPRLTRSAKTENAWSYNSTLHNFSWPGEKVKLSMWESVEAHRVLRRRGSHIF
jgi:hypothetical protein